MGLTKWQSTKVAALTFIMLIASWLGGCSLDQAKQASSLLDANTQADQAACQVSYAFTNQWQGGFNASVTVTNLGQSAINAWQVSFTFAGNQQISNAWGGTFVQNGSLVALDAASWNTIAPAASAQIGFGASYSDDNQSPSQILVNGALCSGSSNGGGDTPPNSGDGQQASVPAPDEPGLFVATNGQLQVSGTQLVNQQGAPIELRGMSTHGLQWFGQFANYNAFKTLRDTWGMNVVRIAMYTAENGYISNPSVKKTVYAGVDAAIRLGLYVIIDWHILSDNDPNIYKTQSIAFFKEMSAHYANTPNVMYEICNEPNGSTSWHGQIKPYAEAVIPVIRANAPNSIIIVGTPTWSQDVDKVVGDALTFNNVMYTVHFYAGTHGGWLRDRIDNVLAQNIPVFITEWGTSEASGGGGVYIDASQQWMDFLRSRKISWANWSLSDKSETSAILNPGASSAGGWTDSNYTQSGMFVKKNMLVGQ